MIKDHENLFDLIDSHAHLTCDQLCSDLDLLIQRAQDQKVQSIINICTDPKSLKLGLEAAKKYSCIKNSASTTPHDVDQEGELFFPLVKEAALQGQLIAIGETGLDYYYTHSKKETQKYYLKKYLELAKKVQLPVVIHCRDAFEDFFNILDQHYQNQDSYYPGVLHCFTGTLKEAKEVIERGFYLSFSGIVTFKKSLELQEVAKFAPLDKILVETDSPYLAPRSKRGRVNEPAFVQETAAFIAGLKGISIEEFSKITKKNSQTLFQIS